MEIKINCHSSIKIGDIYIDPFNIKENSHDAQIIFITHSHYDHLDIASIKKIISTDTKIVCTSDSALKLKGQVDNEIIEVKPNQSGQIEDVKYQTFPSYNYTHHHFKHLGFVGYKLTIEGTSYTICGDSDATEELKSIKTDVLFVPIGGIYTMDYHEAAKLVNIIKPKIVIPVHYGFIEGIDNKELGELFAKEVEKGIEVKLLIK